MSKANIKAEMTTINERTRAIAKLVTWKTTNDSHAMAALKSEYTLLHARYDRLANQLHGR
jgi:hypothetical protein